MVCKSNINLSVGRYFTVQACGIMLWKYLVYSGTAGIDC